MTSTVLVAADAPGRPWLTSDQVMRIAVGVYLTLFFLYMFLPLVYMMLVTFNDSRIPTLTPWKGYTLRWFLEMWADERMWNSVVKSFIIGFWVIVLSVPLGLAGAMFMTRMRVPGQSFVYAVLVSPVLMPGIIIGLSTLVFWDTQFRIGGRWQLSVLGQTSFIAAYCMLIFMARLTRFDRTLEEAALDLGATEWQAFREVTLPALAPGIAAAALLAFTISFDDYVITSLVAGVDSETLPMVIYAMARRGANPVVNAVSTLIVVALGTLILISEKLREA